MKDSWARNEIAELKCSDKWKGNTLGELRTDHLDLFHRHKALMEYLGLEWYEEKVNDGKTVKGIRPKPNGPKIEIETINSPESINSTQFTV